MAQTQLNLSSLNLIQIDSCTFANLVQLQYLDLSHNTLTYLNSSLLGDCVNLLALDLSYNQLTSFNLDGLYNMEYFAIGHNPIVSFYSVYIFNFVNLTYLDMRACNLSISNFFPPSSRIASSFSPYTNHFTQLSEIHFEENLFAYSTTTITYLQLYVNSILNVNLLIIFLQGNPIYDGIADIQSLCGSNTKCVIVPFSNSSQNCLISCMF